MTLTLILSIAGAAYLGAPWWVALCGALLLLTSSLSATAVIRADLGKLATGRLVAQYALMHSALNATAASGSAYLLGVITRQLWG
jgi:hypothetical protein